MTKLPNTEPEFHVFLGDAINQRDLGAIEELQDHVDNWLEMPEERAARMELLSEVWAMVDRLHGVETALR